MKQILLAYLFISLLAVALFSVLSFGYGPGYVYIYWREWQPQQAQHRTGGRRRQARADRRKEKFG